MKEYFIQTTNEKGMYLPFVLFIALILFSAVTSLTLIYKNETEISNQLWEQMKAETLVQMSKQQFVTDKIYEAGHSGTALFTFPSGEVVLTYSEKKENVYFLKVQIETDTGGEFLIDSLVFTQM
ncbi:MAG TPA: hypothetical protein VK085_11720 [Pseudogracilibacillus sp.]|nr:hypothetical protein [Pseudogracilibacillus sp.]